VAAKDSFFLVPVALPKMLNEGEAHSESTSNIHTDFLENIKRLFVWDGADKNWCVSRRQLRKLKQAYRKFHAEP
jgi:hypothetical protein